METSRTHSAGILVLLMMLVAAPGATAALINGTCDQGSVSVSATGSGGTGNSSTALTGWTYTLSQTPYGNFYIGTNISTWNQRPGYTVAGVGSAFHANPSGKSANVQQTVTELQPGGTYSVSAWLLPVLVSGKASGGKLTMAVQNPDTPGWNWGATCGDDESEKGVWANSVLTATASAAGTLDIRIFMELGLGGWTVKSTPNVAFDDITVTLVPEPGAMIAVLVGITVMAFRRRS